MLNIGTKNIEKNKIPIRYPTSYKFKGTDPFWGHVFFTNFGHNYHFLFFLREKVSSGIWETCPKILGGYEYQNPPPKKKKNGG